MPTLVTLYPASSNSSVRLVSFQIVAISACSWPSQHSCVFRKLHPPIVIVHSRPGCRHVVRPSVRIILFSSTRSSHNCDESKILTKPPAGIFWSRTKFFSISVSVSCSQRMQGSYAADGIEGTFHRMLLRMNSETFLSIGARFLYFIHCVAALVSVQIRCCSTPNFHPT